MVDDQQVQMNRTTPREVCGALRPAGVAAAPAGAEEAALSGEQEEELQEVMGSFFRFLVFIVCRYCTLTAILLF